MSIFVGFVEKLISGNEKGALSLLQNAGKAAIIRAVGGGPVGAITGGLLDLLMRSAAGETLNSEFKSVKGLAKSAAKRRLHQMSHQEWLDENRWRFDWRSQPRRPAGNEAGGEWMEGRLDHPVAVKFALSRRERLRRTRNIKAYKARMAGTRTRTIHTAWGDY